MGCFLTYQIVRQDIYEKTRNSYMVLLSTLLILNSRGLFTFTITLDTSNGVLQFSYLLTVGRTNTGEPLFVLLA